MKIFSLGELHIFTSNITLVSIDSDDKELLKNVDKYEIRLLS